MMRLCHCLTYSLVMWMNFSIVSASGEPVPPAESDLQKIEQKIQLVRHQISEIAAEVRDAEALVAEKITDYETTLDVHGREQNAVSASSVDHAQQRLALAEMGLESKAARLQRTEKKLSELIDARQEILAEPPGSTLMPIAHQEQ